MDTTEIIAAAEFLASTIVEEGVDPGFGSRCNGRVKVFLGRVAELLEVEMSEIAAALPALLAAGVHLCRCDLVEAFELEQIEASQVTYLGVAEFHMVVVG